MKKHCAAKVYYDNNKLKANSEEYEKMNLKLWKKDTPKFYCKYCKQDQCFNCAKNHRRDSVKIICQKCKHKWCQATLRCIENNKSVVICLDCIVSNTSNNSNDKNTSNSKNNKDNNKQGGNKSFDSEGDEIIDKYYQKYLDKFHIDVEESKKIFTSFKKLFFRNYIRKKDPLNKKNNGRI